MENKFSNLKRLIDWAEKFESQLSDGAQWDDKIFANWLSDEVNVTIVADKDMPENTESAIAMFIVFMYKYAFFY